MKLSGAPNHSSRTNRFRLLSSLTSATSPSISLSTTYAQSAVGSHKGFEYTRSGNPNRENLESLLASLERGGKHAIAFASGSATTAAVITSLGPGAHILSVNDVYGGTFRYMTKVSGLETSFEDLENLSKDEIYAAIRPNTKVSYIHCLILKDLSSYILQISS